MRALILAAGEGLRLRPLTLDRPKCLIEICGSPILDHQIRALAAAGAQSYVIVTGWQAERINSHVAGDPRVGCLYNPDYATSNILESFRLGSTAVPPGGPLAICAGDVLFGEAVARRLALDLSGSDVALCYGRKACGAEEVKVRLDGDRVIELGKALDPAVCDGEFLGLLAFGPQALEAARAAAPRVLTSQRQAYLFDMLNVLIRQGLNVRASDVSGLPWEEIDYIEDIDRAEQRLRQMSPRS